MVVGLISAGRSKATSGDRILARAFGMLFDLLEDGDVDRVLWMPAHTTQLDVGRLRLSNRDRLSLRDRKGNDTADQLAKAAVEEHRVPLQIREAIEKAEAAQTNLAKWVATASVLANHSSHPPRDSTASRHNIRYRRSVRAKAASKPAVAVRPVALGGHNLEKHGKFWSCSLCKSRSAKWSSIAGGVCTGSAVRTWAKRAATLASRDIILGKGHTFAIAGTLSWCSTCGAYADQALRTTPLSKPCPGRRKKRR